MQSTTPSFQVPPSKKQRTTIAGMWKEAQATDFAAADMAAKPPNPPPPPTHQLVADTLVLVSMEPLMS